MNALNATSDQERIALRALRGLWKFRAGDVVGGRADYEHAIAEAELRRLKTMRSLALWHLAQEESVAKTDVADSTILRAEAASKGVKLPELSAIRERLMNDGGAGSIKSRMDRLKHAVRSKRDRT